jgi:hypothetical protein
VTTRYKRVLKYWKAADDPKPREVDVTDRQVRVDGAILELLKDDGSWTKDLDSANHPMIVGFLKRGAGLLVRQLAKTPLPSGHIGFVIEYTELDRS